MQVTKENFFSMDRLVEFGMGMAMSQQIAQSMNNMMASMQMMPQMQVAAQPLYVQQPLQQGMPMQPVYRQYAGQPQPAVGQAAMPVGQPVQAVGQNPAGQNPAAFAQGGQASIPSAGQAAAKEELPALPPPLPEAYYVAQEASASGPYSCTELVRLVAEKKLSASTPVWKTGMKDWQKAESFPELLCLISMVPPPISIQEGQST